MKQIIVLSLTMALNCVAFASDFQGKWQGVYEYNSGVQVKFEAEIQQSGSAISATISEPDTFAGGTALSSTIAGVVEGNSLKFTKTYKGLPRQPPPVQYLGHANGNQVAGGWQINAETAGQFSMTKLGESNAIATPPTLDKTAPAPLHFIKAN